MKITLRIASTLLFIFVLLHWETIFANPVAFTKGDASFVGVVHKQSSFLKDGIIVDAVTLFCCAQELDYTKGIELDISIVPEIQLKALRKATLELLAGNSTKNPAVLVCVTDSKFDFEKTWLGVPYNQNPQRLVYTDTVTNCFGPSGASNLSIRDSSNVPPLAVESVSEARYKVTETCCFCLLTVENSVLQRVRHVIGVDGKTKIVEFRYVPQSRVCFEEGDVFFVAKADQLLHAKNEDVELEYLLSDRRRYGFFGNDFVLSEDELLEASANLTVLPKGQRIVLKNVPEGIPQWLVSDNKSLPWFVFLVAADYDATKFRLGRRYNKESLKSPVRPLPTEFVDCNFCTETFPVAMQDFSWPPPLPVTWVEDNAYVDMNEIQLVFIQSWAETPFYDVQLDKIQYRFKKNRVEHWSKRKLERVSSW